MVAFRQSFDTSTLARNYIQRRKSISLRLKAHSYNESRSTTRSLGASVAATRMDDGWADHAVAVREARRADGLICPDTRQLHCTGAVWGKMTRI